MSLGREFKTCFISLILLLSLLSVFVITPENVKAEPIEETTTLYFHDVPVEDVLDEDLIDLLGLYLEEFDDDFDEILEEIMELEDKLFYDYDNLTESEIEDIEDQLDELYNLLLESGRLEIGNIIDGNPPTKTNDSEYPPTLSKFIKILFGGDLKTLISNLLKGEGLNEEMLIEFEEFIEDMLSSLASFRGFYVYNGDESVSLSGEVTFNLYFSSPLNYILDNDTANIGFVVYDVDLSGGSMESKFTESESIEIKRWLLNPLKNPIEYEIPIMVDTDLEPGDIIMVDLDIVAGERHLFDYLDDINISELGLNETFEALAELINSTELEFLAPLSDMLLNLSALLTEDFSTENLTAILEGLTSSFIYDSVSHPSSLTLPGPIGVGGGENIKTYYLHSDNIMNEDPADGETKEVDLKNVAKWDGPALERSKIIKEATASLYIDHQDLIRLLNILRGKIKVTASLLYEGEEISSSTEEFGKTTFLDMLMKPSEPTRFTFTGSGEEIRYGDSLGLEVFVSNGTKFGILSFRRNAKLLYGSSDFPSSLVVKFDETDNINIDGDQSDKIVALGESVEYNLIVTSEFAEEITMEVSDFSTDEKDDWDIDIIPESFSIDAGSQETITVVVTSTDDDLDAYTRGDQLTVVFVAAGKTGKGLFEADVEISEDAIKYDIEVTINPLKQEIRHGENDTYVFTIKNKNMGLWSDSYSIEAESEHNWATLSYDEEDLKGVAVGDEVQVEVTISVPQYTDVTSDKLTFKVISKESKKHTSTTVNVTTSVAGPNVLENLYHFFESLGEDMGLDEILGSSSNAAIFLASIVFIIIFFIIIILMYFLTIKYVNVVCLERIKEISPDEEAKFEITVQNPYKKKLSYEIYVEENSSSPGWGASLDTENIELEPKQSKTVILIVKPTSFVKPNDWAEVKVVAKVFEKQKFAKLLTVTTIKNAQPELRICGVLHWPKAFKKGDRVMTSFKLENRGSASASNISVVLYVNNKEKNKVEDITIPSGGYADIEMPWIAVKGKNEVNIVVK
jgi:hypothetical protein